MSKKSESFTPDKLRKAMSAFHAETGSKILTASKVKACLQHLGLRMDGDFVDALATDVYRLILKASQRTVDNKRTTVRPFDL